MTTKKYSVLVVDDERATCANITKILNIKGFTAYEAHEGEEALKFLDERFVDVVLLDIKMPKMDGITALGKIKKKFPEIEVIMVTAFSDLESAVESMKLGAYGFLTKPISLEQMVMEINKALERKALTLQLRMHEKRLKMKIDDKAEEINYLYKLLEKNFNQSVRMFVDLIALYDPALAGHSKRVAALASKTGKLMNMNEKRLRDLELAALLHDFGKLGLPQRMRSLPLRQLSHKERDLARKQTILVQKTLGGVEQLKRAGLIIRSHLERVDGRGFPDGLKGDQIPLESKVLSVASSYVAVWSESGDDDAVDHLKRNTGRRYARQVVKAFLDTLEKVKFSQDRPRATPLTELKEGMILAKDLVADNGERIMAKGNQMNTLQIAKIKNYDLFVSPITQKIYVVVEKLKV